MKPSLKLQILRKVLNDLAVKDALKALQNYDPPAEKLGVPEPSSPDYVGTYSPSPSYPSKPH